MKDSDSIIELYVAKDEPSVRIVESALIAANIKCRVVGENLGAAAGDLPLGISTGPAIWVAHDNVDAARRVIQEFEEPASVFRVPSWQCPRCDSEVDAGFDVCWNCLYNPSAC